MDGEHTIFEVWCDIDPVKDHHVQIVRVVPAPIRTGRVGQVRAKKLHSLHGKILPLHMAKWEIVCLFANIYGDPDYFVPRPLGVAEDRQARSLGVHAGICARKKLGLYGFQCFESVNEQRHHRL